MLVFLKETIKKLFNKSTKEYTVTELINMSNDRNGYIREEAVYQLGLRGDAIAIPTLFARVNDWVYEVRVASKKSLIQLLTQDNVEAFVRELPKLYKLERYTRENHTQFIEQIIDYLISGKHQQYIVQAFDSEDIYLARMAQKLCIEYKLIDREKLIEKSLSHTDLVIRLSASNLLCELNDQRIEYFLDIAIDDKFMPIRREAFQLFIERFPQKSLAIANNLLFDRHNSIREIAIVHLNKNNLNVEAMLINSLLLENQTNIKIKASIYGLSVIGSKKSIPIIEPFLAHKLPKIRVTTLQSLSILLGEYAQSYLEIALQDKSPKVAKEASRIINRLKIQIPIMNILEICETVKFPHTVSICISSTLPLDKWDRLLLFLTLFTSKKIEKKIKKNLIYHEFKRWDYNFNKTKTQPSDLQISRIVNEYNKGSELFDDKTAQSIEFTIRSITRAK